jgi:hypothetical protein
MSRNDAEDFAQRLYARVPAHYRGYDTEQGGPLLALLRVVGRQVAVLRQDIDFLWDNFFVETCEDWVVPYLGALVGTNLLARPVGQSNRLDVRRTVLWRRSKGTPGMLRSLAGAISGWPADLDEFFDSLGWSQNLNHLRLNRPLTMGLRAPGPLDELGRAGDPWAHAADFKTARPVDSSRTTGEALGMSRAAWGTPGRYQVKNVGVFVRRLPTFKVLGATPAAAAPGVAVPAAAAVFTFDPLFRGVPLFVEQTGAPLSRAAFHTAPWETFGTDVAVRQFGVLLASDASPVPEPSSSRTAFTFGQAAAGLALHPTAGLRLISPGSLSRGGVHFVITALWVNDDGSAPTVLGTFSTFHAALGDGDAFHPQPATAVKGTGRLAVAVEPGHPGPDRPKLFPSRAARFPGAIIAVRAQRTGALHAADGLYVYLPPAHVAPGKPAQYLVADDGSTYDFSIRALARASDGQVYPPRALSPSTAPAYEFTALNRAERGMLLPDPARFGGAQVLVQAELFTRNLQPPDGAGLFLTLGAVATAPLAAAAFPDLSAPANWPAFVYAPAKATLTGLTVPPASAPPVLCVQVRPLAGAFLPAAEVVLVNRDGQALLVYLPEVGSATADGVRLLVADDGSTYQIPPDVEVQKRLLTEGSFGGLTLARAAAGQALPLPDTWPMQQRRAVAVDLCRFERNALLAPGELGVDPEHGLFAFPPGDPAIGQPGLSVDYTEAFSDGVGARTFDRSADVVRPATRLVAQSGDSGSPLANDLTHAPLHRSIADALAAAINNDVIEIVDSSTYASATETVLQPPAAVTNLSLRAGADQRPCLSYYDAQGAPTPNSLRVASTLQSLELDGLLMSGGALRVDATVGQLRLTACTLDPNSSFDGNLLATPVDPSSPTVVTLLRCITGGLRLAAGVTRLVAADTIIDQQGGLAACGLAPAGALAGPAPPAGDVQLERVTVLGRVRAAKLTASECLLCDLARVDDQQTGCIRFSRIEPGSVLPGRYQCLPAEAHGAAGASVPRFAPVFTSLRFGQPGYAQLAAGCPPELLSASEAGSEIGAFAVALNTLRLANLQIKLAEFLPVGIRALIIAET